MFRYFFATYSTVHSCLLIYDVVRSKCQWSAECELAGILSCRFNHLQVNEEDVDEVLSLILQLEQMRQQRLSKRVPPSDYLCHLCFQKGHFIKDCPQVSLELVLASVYRVVRKKSFVTSYFIR